VIGNRKTFTFVAALRHNRMVAPLLINGAMNGETFRAYIEQFVVPILKRNDIVAIDNLPAHNVAGIEETINAVGATLRYLPEIFTRPQPDRIALQQIQGVLAQACRTHRPHPPPRHPLVPADPQATGMQPIITNMPGYAAI